MNDADDLWAVAQAFGVRIERKDLEPWVPIIRALRDDLARLMDLPLERCEPAFIAGLEARRLAGKESRPTGQGKSRTSETP